MKPRQNKIPKDYAQSRQRKRDENGNIVIDMTVKNDDDFLSVYSGSEAPIISSDVADFIENSTRSLPPQQAYTLRIHSNCIDDKEKIEYDSAIKEYYAEKYFANKKELRINRIIVLLLLMAGVLVLSLAFQVENHIWSEVIDIAAWVLLWEAVDIWAFKNRELNIKAKRCLAFMDMKVEYMNIKNK